MDQVWAMCILSALLGVMAMVVAHLAAEGTGGLSRAAGSHGGQAPFWIMVCVMVVVLALLVWTTASVLGRA